LRSFGAGSLRRGTAIEDVTITITITVTVAVAGDGCTSTGCWDGNQNCGKDPEQTRSDLSPRQGR
jgi:hypothetical protein